MLNISSFCPKCGGHMAEKPLFSSTYFECDHCDSAQSALKSPPEASTHVSEASQRFGHYKSDNSNRLVSDQNVDPRDLDNYATDGGTPGVFNAQSSVTITSKTPALEITKGGMVWQPIYDNRTGREIGRLFLRNVSQSGK